MGNPLPPTSVFPALAVGPTKEAATRVMPPEDSIVSAGPYTLVLQDFGLWKRYTGAGAATITVPPNSAVPFPLNTAITFSQDGAGQLTLAAGAGVTLNSAGAKLKTATQFSVLGIFQNQPNVWTVFGDRA